MFKTSFVITCCVDLDESFQKKKLKIEIFKQNVMIRERIDRKSFRFRKCERIVLWRVKNEREIVHNLNVYRARIFIEIVDFHL
jgi:hypothetical protein